MKKKRSLRRLAQRLTEDGYEAGCASPIHGDYSFVKARTDGLYEFIVCNFFGRRNEAATCCVGVSAVRLSLVEGLGETSLVLEVDSDQEAGWTIIEADADLHRWEDLVAEIAVPKATEFADAMSDSLLRRTAQARAAANKCISLLCANSLLESCLELKHRSTVDEQRLAKRMADWVGVQCVSGATHVYEFACLSVIVFLHRDNPPNPANRYEMPSENQSLMWEIQLVADELLWMERKDPEKNVIPDGI